MAKRVRDERVISAESESQSKISDRIDYLINNGTKKLSEFHLNEALADFSAAKELILAINVKTDRLGEIEKRLKQISLGMSEEEIDDEEESCTDMKNVLFVQGSEECSLWFDTVVGMDREKNEMRDSFMNPLIYPKLYGKVAKGLLLYGPPGVGKTYLVKAAINELTSQQDKNINILFFAPTAAEMKGKYFGESEKNIRRIFRCASKRACECQDDSNSTTISIIFIDEVESVAPDRSKDSSGLAATTVNALLQVIDGVESSKNVVVITATNYPWQLDAAFLRRFERRIFVDLPNQIHIYDLLNLQYTLYLEYLQSNIIGKSMCSLKKSSEPAQCFNTCERTNSRVFGWKDSPLKEYTTITESELRALAAYLYKNSYSNSDIDKVFKRAIKIAADKAISDNIFLKLDENLYISSLAITPVRLREIYNNPAERSKISFLEQPEFSKIIFNSSNKKDEYIPKELCPLLTISDERINGVYFDIGSCSSTTSNEIKILLKTRTRIFQADAQDNVTNAEFSYLRTIIGKKYTNDDPDEILPKFNRQELVQLLNEQTDSEIKNNILKKLSSGGFESPSLYRDLTVLIGLVYTYKSGFFDRLRNAAYVGRVFRYFKKEDKKSILPSTSLNYILDYMWENNKKIDIYIPTFTGIQSTEITLLDLVGIQAPSSLQDPAQEAKILGNTLINNLSSSAINVKVSLYSDKVSNMQNFLSNLTENRIDATNLSTKSDATSIDMIKMDKKQASNSSIEQRMTNPNISYDILKQASTEIQTSIDTESLKQLREYSKNPSYKPPTKTG